MLVYVLGAVALGIGAAGVVLLLSRLFRVAVPGWTLPIVAGAAMIGFHIWSEYSWYARTAAALPPHLAVAATHRSSSPLQPWTYLFPRIDRFSVVNAQTIQRNPRVPNLRIAEVFLVERYMPTVSTMQIYDCERPQRADVVQTLDFDASGNPVGVRWIPLDGSDPLRRTVCADAVSRAARTGRAVPAQGPRAA